MTAPPDCEDEEDRGNRGETDAHVSKSGSIVAYGARASLDVIDRRGGHSAQSWIISAAEREVGGPG